MHASLGHAHWNLDHRLARCPSPPSDPDPTPIEEEADQPGTEQQQVAGLGNRSGPGTVADPSPTPAHRGGGELLAGKPSRASRGFVTAVVRVLQRYFAGEPHPLEKVPIDLECETAFLARCARALRDVPRGEVVTYGELAALAGAPGAARAAGSFCARNRLGLFVPCHRVVGAGGGALGRSGGG